MTMLYFCMLAIIIAAAGSVSALHDSVLMEDVCDGKLQQLANDIRSATEDILAESVELALTVFSGFRPLLHRKNALQVSSSYNNHHFPYSQRSAHITSAPVNLKSLYADISNALKLKRSAKQYVHGFHLSDG